MSQDITRVGMAARYSEAAVFKGTVFLAGMVPERGDTDIRGQTEDVLQQVAQRLQECGTFQRRGLLFWQQGPQPASGTRAKRPSGTRVRNTTAACRFSTRFHP